MPGPTDYYTYINYNDCNNRITKLCPAPDDLARHLVYRDGAAQESGRSITAALGNYGGQIMKLMLSTALAATLMLTLPACQQQGESEAPAAEAAAAGSIEAMNGTWKVDLASLKFEQKPDEFLLKDASYSCPTCLPPLTAAADGQYHPVSDRPYYDSLSTVSYTHLTLPTTERV